MTKVADAEDAEGADDLPVWAAEAQLRRAIARDSLHVSGLCFRRFLDAGMPAWLAHAANAQMNAQLAALAGMDRDSAARRWIAFIRNFAEHGDGLQVP